MIEGIFRKGNDLILRYNKNGESFFKKVKTKYPLYIQDRNGNYKYIFKNIPLTKRVYNTKKELKESKQIAELSNQLSIIYSPEVELLFPLWNKLQGQNPKSLIWYLDIEVIDLDNRIFPEPYLANAPITHIQIVTNRDNRVILYMLQKPSQEFINKYKNNTEIIIIPDEKEMLLTFIKRLQQEKPTIITAWNGENFDFPYITYRCQKLGISINKLSPLNDSSIEYVDNKYYHTKWNGLYLLDALQIYKKFTYTDQKSYSLEYIAKVELGEGQGKVDYGEYRNIFEFFEKNYDKFCEYARQDPIVLKNIVEKTGIFDIVIDMSSTMGINFDKIVGTVQPWARFLTLLALRDNIILPEDSYNKDNAKPIKGGFVKEPITGKHEWICSIDFNSMYPNNINTFNLSAETYIPYEELPQEAKEIIDYMADENEDKLFDEEFRKKIAKVTKKYNIIFAGLGFFRKDKKGIIPSIIEQLYVGRKQEKQKMLIANALKEKLKEKLN